MHAMAVVHATHPPDAQHVIVMQPSEAAQVRVSNHNMLHSPMLETTETCPSQEHACTTGKLHLRSHCYYCAQITASGFHLRRPHPKLQCGAAQEPHHPGGHGASTDHRSGSDYLAHACVLASTINFCTRAMQCPCASCCCPITHAANQLRPQHATSHFPPPTT